MSDFTDKVVAEKAKAVATYIRNELERIGWDIPASNPFPSGNVDGGWIVEATSTPGFTLNIEVIAGPWENDGTYEEAE